MSTADGATGVLAPTAAPWKPPPERRHRGEVVPAQDRGELSIADQVVEKIAAIALGEVDQIGGVARRVLGVALGSTDPDRLPQVTAQINGSVVTVAARCSVTYPAPVGRVTEEARAHLIERVAALTGLSVAQVDITVTALSTDTPLSRRELQ
jgi:uncharacterized alkaline shock family protein YloU